MVVEQLQPGLVVHLVTDDRGMVGVTRDDVAPQMFLAGEGVGGGEELPGLADLAAALAVVGIARPFRIVAGRGLAVVVDDQVDVDAEGEGGRALPEPEIVVRRVDELRVRHPRMTVEAQRLWARMAQL